jgi:hypothetical protein
MLGEWQNRIRAAAYRLRLLSSYSGKTGHNQIISNPWHAVSIMPGGNACRAARDVRGVRRLSTEASRLPLTDCHHPESCACRYQHHSDRRRERRRARDNGLPTREYSGRERRALHRGRRALDESA